MQLIVMEAPMFKFLMPQAGLFMPMRWTFIVFSFSALLLLPVFMFNTYLGVAAAPDKHVHVWLTTRDGYNKLSRQKNIVFGDDRSSARITIDVNENQQLQQMEGFGAAMTDSSAWLIGTKMTATQRNAVMHALFDPAQGIGISFVRVPMGSSDYTVSGPYSYDDLPNGHQDPALEHFSINHDIAYIIPLLRQAQQIHPNLRYMANPWSPPAWMKTNQSILGVSHGQTGSLLPTAYGPLARYFVKFIQAYEEQGVPIYAISPQNEPLYAPPSYAGMSFPAEEEAQFIKNDLGPALTEAHLNTKLLAYDYPWVNLEYPVTLLDDPDVRRYIAGIAWHCYMGKPSAMTMVHQVYQAKGMYETECSTGPAGSIYPAVDLAIRSTQESASTTVLWNLALDTQGGPKMGRGCDGCNSLVTIDQATGNYVFTDNYYQLGHVSKFVTPGAYHIASISTDESKLLQVAFKNPDGSIALVVHNTSSSSVSFKVRRGDGQSFLYMLPAGGIASFVWNED